MLFDRFKRVKAFVFTVDGVLTDGTFWLTTAGEQLRRFHSKDRYAIQIALQRNYPIAVTGIGNAKGIVEKMEEMGIQGIFFDKGGNKAVWNDWLAGVGLAAEDILFMGADIPDVSRMKNAGFPTCPADAAEEVKTVASYISFCKGGEGAVRDVIEKVMKLQGTWGGN